MIASLRGQVIDKGRDYVVIECHGVGYHCHSTPQTLSSLHRGEEGFIYTSLQVKEDSHTLYGFLDKESREFFLLLLSVSGVGAKMALAFLSTLTPSEAAQAMRTGDYKSLQRVPGVGKRTAERVVMELKEKVAVYIDARESHDRGAEELAPSDSSSTSSHSKAKAMYGHSIIDVRNTVSEALTGLGFPEQQFTPILTMVIDSVQHDIEQGTLDPSELSNTPLILKKVLVLLGSR